MTRIPPAGWRHRLRLLAAVAAGASLLALTGCMAWRVTQAAELARASEPFRQSPADATTSLLIVGDSTGVGTGATSPAASVAGLIAAEHPRLHIDNRAVDGARLADVAAQLAAAGPHDVVLVMAGGNDVIRLTGKDALRDAVERVVTRAAQLAPTVIVMPSGNVGNAPFFVPPLSWWMAKRSRQLHALVRDAASRHGAIYVDLYKEHDRDPFVLQPGMHARDGLHPSDAGYRQWYGELRQQAGIDDLLRR